jgi:integrative and conjugative element protein (TIGR02256 family)
MSKTIFNLPNHKKLKISFEVIELMFSYAQDSFVTLESGGILIGRILESTSDYVIDVASTPMLKDIQARSSFKRDEEAHQEFFDKHWVLQEGRCFYLGEWHTHPEKVPRPSQIDVRGWKELLNAGIQDQMTLFFIIVGTQQLIIWQGCIVGGRVRIARLGHILRNEIT